MRLNPLYAPDGMTSTDMSRPAERFDDGLVHNHHWAVTGDEAYPSCLDGSASGRDHGLEPRLSPFQSFAQPPQAHDRHDDGLVHNHHWPPPGSNNA